MRHGCVLPAGRTANGRIALTFSELPRWRCGGSWWDRASEKTASNAAKLAALRKTDARGLSKALRGDLDAIIMKSLEPDRQLRYDTVNNLATIQPSLEAAKVFRFLGERNAIFGRWKQASECFVKLMEANRLESPAKTATGSDLLLAGPALLEDGNADGYDRIRREMLERISHHPRFQRCGTRGEDESSPPCRCGDDENIGAHG